MFRAVVPTAVMARAQALGWLVMLLPTQQAARRDGAWDAWLREWLRLWGLVYHSSYWDTLWLHLIARLAKHDTAGAPGLMLGGTHDEMMCFRPIEHAAVRVWIKLEWCCLRMG